MTAAPRGDLERIFAALERASVPCLFEQAAREQRHAWLATTPEQRIAWLEQAKRFAHEALQAAIARRDAGGADSADS